MDDKVRENLLQANSKEEILRIIDDADDEATKEEEKKLKSKRLKHKQQLVHQRMIMLTNLTF